MKSCRQMRTVFLYVLYSFQAELVWQLRPDRYLIVVRIKFITLTSPWHLFRLCVLTDRTREVKHHHHQILVPDLNDYWNKQNKMKMESVSCRPQRSELTTPMSWKQCFKQHRPCACTYRGPLPFDGHWNALAKEERGVGGRKIWILKQDALLQTLLPQLLKRLPVWLRDLGLAGVRTPAGQSRLEGHLLPLRPVEWRRRYVRWLVKDLLCLRHGDEPVWAVDTPSSRHELVCPPPAVKLAPAGTLSLGLVHINCKNPLLMS